uniref:YitH acetyltransferase (GNAT) domain-containing protein n=1 Tax=Panagrolaimus superbus TaxID=310955 RepID=A0A914Y8S9_9BILA
MLGFNKYPDWQYEDMEADTKEINHENLEKNRLVKTISFESVDFKEFVCYDSHITGGIRRDGFIKRFMESKDAFSKVATDCDGKIVGYGNIRVGSNKQLAIGPLYADSGDIAETLLKDILKSINHITQYNKIFYYPSTSNNHAKEIFFKLASNKVRENDKMFVQFSDTIPKISAGKIFSITEYGLGFC